MSLVPVSSCPFTPVWSRRRGSEAAGALGREAQWELAAAEQRCVLLQRALGARALCVRK